MYVEVYVAGHYQVYVWGREGGWSRRGTQGETERRLRGQKEVGRGGEDVHVTVMHVTEGGGEGGSRCGAHPEGPDWMALVLQLTALRCGCKP